MIAGKTETCCAFVHIEGAGGLSWARSAGSAEEEGREQGPFRAMEWQPKHLHR